MGYRDLRRRWGRIDAATGYWIGVNYANRLYFVHKGALLAVDVSAKEAVGHVIPGVVDDVAGMVVSGDRGYLLQGSDIVSIDLKRNRVVDRTRAPGCSSIINAIGELRDRALVCETPLLNGSVEILAVH